MPAPSLACPFRACLVLALWAWVAGFVEAREIALNGHNFSLPDALEIVPAAEQGLVERPICADFDPQGYLYVAESSGSNDDVQTQLAERPHRLLRLHDADGDGVFDRKTVFVDRLMLPEGVLWHEGSVYVAAPPVIWKFTDADGDGVAERREAWFDGQTLTGCANDLHGPFAGRDGWIYWCKGAFAEQTYPRRDGSQFVTRAAHIFRRRPEGGIIEPVMTGGMDNPVEAVFTPSGELIFSTTFLQHPGGGRRDGLIHALYGGVYGKQHSVLDDHPRTGPLLEPLVHLGPAAPSGLALLETNGLGDAYQGALATCCFNLRQVACHQLVAEGSTFATRELPLLVSDNIDFHPTDVLEDADGSLLVIDTGGWYKLCCPTSHMWKPDVLGALYRVRRVGAQPPDDARGRKIAWDELPLTDCAALLSDARPAVRREAARRLAQSPDAPAAQQALTAALKSSSAEVRTAAVWALCQRGGDAALAAVRAALADADPTVRQAAIHACSVWRDTAARDELARLAHDGLPAERRAAAQALGRLGDVASVATLLAAAERIADRAHEHALIYALVELNAPAATRAGLEHAPPAVQRVALQALAEMPQSDLAMAEAAEFLQADDASLRTAAWGAFARRPSWLPTAAETLRGVFAHAAHERQADSAALAAYVNQVGDLATAAEIQQATAWAAAQQALPLETRRALLEAVRDAPLDAAADDWRPALADLLSDPTRALAAETVALLQRAPGLVDEPLRQALLQTADDQRLPEATRVQALAAAGVAGSWTAAQWDLLVGSLRLEAPPLVRLAALDGLLAAAWTPGEAQQVAAALATTGPSELRQLAPRLMDDEEAAVRDAAALALCGNAAAESLDPQLVAAWAERCTGAPAQAALADLQRRIVAQSGDVRERMEALLAEVGSGDPRNGLRVFHSSKAGCITCHEIGYAGGQVGPDLTQIGRIRSARDLAEAILFPSASFVRSYEPTVLVLSDGRVLSGIIRDETRETITITLDAQKTITVPQSDVEERQPGEVSVMPAGLDKTLTPEELRDLLALLLDSK